MKKSITVGLILAAFALSSAFAQDWYHDRDARYQGTQWRAQVFTQVRADLDHIWSARGASEKENQRLDKTKEELTRMQADLDQGRFDNGILNDVIDSLKKSADDQRLSPKDRAVIADDLNRLHDYQQNHNHWKG
jgi:cell division protein FtsB